MKKIHITALKTALQCPRRYKWSEDWEVTRPEPYLSRGRIIHEALQLYHHPGTNLTLKRAYEIAIEAEGARGYEFDEEVNTLVAGILQHYHLFYNNPNRKKTLLVPDDRIDFIDVERPFIMRFQPWQANLELHGRFDGVVWDREQRGIWVFETKTVRSLSEFQTTIDYDLQPLAYTLALKDTYPHLKVLGVMYNLLRSKVPNDPRFLKNGSLSLAKNQDSSFDWFIHKLQAVHGMTREEIMADSDVMGLLRSMETRSDQWFTRVCFRPSEGQLDWAYRYIYERGLELNRDSYDYHPTMHYWGCRTCPFIDPCNALRSDSLVHDMPDYGFRPRSDRARVTRIDEHGITIEGLQWDLDGVEL